MIFSRCLRRASDGFQCLCVGTTDASAQGLELDRACRRLDFQSGASLSWRDTAQFPFHPGSWDFLAERIICHRPSPDPEARQKVSKSGRSGITNMPEQRRRARNEHLSCFEYPAPIEACQATPRLFALLGSLPTEEIPKLQRSNRSGPHPRNAS